ncbi:trans-sulfuration enzyme family protein [Orrella daihaiensis]|uniref:PLP-dependent transferase n=1 Tax=Orrella daihaiensis TaxID=2782176 RepID=A0ABY4AJT3_9BURK|nr:PLP-dependent aspartate aminotransferase family protein [Orrella daihaiensis]UOD50548.1 PLP-dependent transferase [Orrella daihaiensis]
MTHHRDTKLLHIDSAPFDPLTDSAPVSLPSVRTSTVRFKNLSALEKTLAKRADGQRVFTYGIGGLQTHRALEEVFNTLENGNYCVLSGSGLASIHLVFMSVLKAGDHVLISDNVYGPVRNLNDTLLKRLNIEATFFSPSKDDLDTLIRPNTKMLYLESPGSLLMEMLDLPDLCAKAHRHGLVVATDNTWGTYIYQPLTLGADISIIAGTKYVNGHSDLLIGAVVTNRDDLAGQINQMQYALGNSISADDVWLSLRGAKTLGLRLREHANQARRVSEFLATHPKVSRIYDPAWPDDPGHGLWRRDCSGANGLLSISLNCTPTDAKAFVDRLTLFGIGFSWGGFESLVQWVSPAALTNHHYWQEQGKAVVRLHIGLENVEDLIADLDQALSVLPDPA